MKVQILGVSLLLALGAGVSRPALADATAKGVLITAGTADEVDVSSASYTTTSSFQRLVQVKAAAGVIVYRHDLDLPAGARVQAGADEGSKVDLAGDLQVIDGRGRTLGAIDAAWAQDASGQALPSHFRIEGTTLVQFVDASSAAGEVTLLLQYTGAASEAAGVGGRVTNGYVGVPSNYVYNLNHPRRTLHDYCTKSPDEFPNPVGANANFRGPCARHDMCFEQRQASQFTCNNRLWSDMKSNCEYTYAWYNPVRASCISTANVYWVAVTANTLWPW